MLEVSWKKDGSTEIHKADIARPHNKTLVVKLVEIAEEGIYECEVRNTRGTATARSLVRVVPTSTTGESCTEYILPNILKINV